jgi:hypothetical protein
MDRREEFENRVLKMNGESSTHETRNVNKVLVRKPQGNIPLGKPIHKLEDNIKWIL